MYGSRCRLIAWPVALLHAPTQHNRRASKQVQHKIVFLAVDRRECLKNYGVYDRATAAQHTPRTHGTTRPGGVDAFDTFCITAVEHKNMQHTHSSSLGVAVASFISNYVLYRRRLGILRIFSMSMEILRC